MVEGVDDYEEGFEDASSEALKDVDFLEGDEGEKFVGIVQRIPLNS